jgi:hypothetical protein
MFKPSSRRDTLASKQGGFCGQPFDVGRGMQHGNINWERRATWQHQLAVAFNVVIDAINRDIEVCRTEETAATAQLLHANDRVIAGDNPKKVQRLMDDHTERFSRVGLKMNDKKPRQWWWMGQKHRP